MKKRILILAVAAVVIALSLGVYARWGPTWPWTISPDAGAGSDKKPEEARTEIVLSPEKFSTMKITCVSVTKQPVQQVRTVPGRIQYRGVNKVELKAPVDSVVQKVHVKPGDAVQPGTRLALLTSPAVGMARAEVEKSASELRIANQALEWAEDITTNLNDLLKLLRTRPKLEAVEKEFEDKLLGDHRHIVLPAYSKYRLAETLWETSERLLNQGAISEQKFDQRKSNYEVAREEYVSVCEQSKFDARQAREKARQGQNFARRLVDVSVQKLQTLLGAFSKVAEPNEAAAGEGAELTRFYLIAPFEGTVEQRLASDSQRVAEGTLLFAVANTETLEVAADIREGDWQVVTQLEGKEVKVRVPAVGEEREFQARVDYVGRAVDPETRALPLIALLDNSRHEFKPGMFARITIPTGAAEEALVVPPGALRTQDQQDFVFVEDRDEPRKFRRVDVTVGKRTTDWVAIASGLEAGQRVVVEGSFLLKSELLLEPEDE